MSVIDKKLLNQFLKKAGDKLKGDWILIGGTVLPLLGVDHRVTVDIDLMPLAKTAPNSMVIELMRLAEDLGLPPEAINASGLYFLEKIPNYSEQLVLLAKGKSAKIYRPSATLFLRLKISRLTESDLTDCLQMIMFAKSTQEPIDQKTLKKAIQIELGKKLVSKEHVQRLEKLNRVLDSRSLP